MRIVHCHLSAINIIPAEPDGDRDRLVTEESTGTFYPGVTLLLSDFRVWPEGRAGIYPKVALSIHVQWVPGKYDPVTNLNPDRDVLDGNYQSKTQMCPNLGVSPRGYLTGEIGR